MLTPDELTTLRIQIGHHKGVSNVVAISVERMESLFQMLDAQAARIDELEQQHSRLLTACRRAVLALAAASEKDAAFRIDYEAMSDAIRKATPSASQTADSEPQASLCRNGEAQECQCNDAIRFRKLWSHHKSTGGVFCIAEIVGVDGSGNAEWAAVGDDFHSLLDRMAEAE